MPYLDLLNLVYWRSVCHESWLFTIEFEWLSTQQESNEDEYWGDWWILSIHQQQHKNHFYAAGEIGSKQYEITDKKRFTMFNATIHAIG